MTVNGTVVGAPQTLTFSTSGAITPVGAGILPFNGYAPTDGAAGMKHELQLFGRPRSTAAVSASHRSSKTATPPAN